MQKGKSFTSARKTGIIKSNNSEGRLDLYTHNFYAFLLWKFLSRFKFDRQKRDSIIRFLDNFEHFSTVKLFPKGLFINYVTQILDFFEDGLNFVSRNTDQECPRSLDFRFFFIYDKFHGFLMKFCLFWHILSIISILPSRAFLGSILWH